MESTIRQLSALATGQLEPDIGRDFDEDPLVRLIESIRECWLEERRGALRQALVAVEQISDSFQREKERTLELEAAQDQLVQATKLASLGTLAAGIAHELNQPLTAILALIDLVNDDPGARVGDKAGDLQRVREAAERLAHIVGGIRSFGRQDVFQTRAFDPTLPTEKAVELARRSFELDRVRVRCDLEADVGTCVLGDPGQLQQVVLNLLTNARDAVRGCAEPEVRLCSRIDGKSCLIDVSDNGPGIDEHALARIFDPFFTTKQAGEGTGLGLSVSHSIVERHNGEIEHLRDKGWTRFRIRLPCVGPDR
ncbi:MAG: ATP-binding protein [Planctomycetota bacterium]